MKTYEIHWQPGDCSMAMQIEIIHANSLEEATKMVEAKARMLGVKSIGWYTKKEIT